MSFDISYAEMTGRLDTEHWLTLYTTGDIIVTHIAHARDFERQYHYNTSITPLRFGNTV